MWKWQHVGAVKGLPWGRRDHRRHAGNCSILYLQFLSCPFYLSFPSPFWKFSLCVHFNFLDNIVQLLDSLNHFNINELRTRRRIYFPWPFWPWHKPLGLYVSFCLKNGEKIRENVFTFQLRSKWLHLFWRDFFTVNNFNFSGFSEVYDI